MNQLPHWSRLIAISSLELQSRINMCLQNPKVTAQFACHGHGLKLICTRPIGHPKIQAHCAMQHLQDKRVEFGLHFICITFFLCELSFNIYNSGKRCPKSGGAKTLAMSAIISLKALERERWLGRVDEEK